MANYPCGKQIGRSGVQVKEENEKFTVLRSRSPQNLQCGHFTLLFCRGRQRNVPKCKTHVQSDCLQLIKPIVLRRFRCRCRRRCLSSLKAKSWPSQTYWYRGYKKNWSYLWSVDSVNRSVDRKQLIREFCFQFTVKREQVTRFLRECEGILRIMHDE